MTKKGAALIAFVLAGLGAAGAAAAASGPSSPEPSPRPRPPPAPPPEPEPEGPDVYTIGPGWFWYFVDWRKDGTAFAAFQKANRGNFEVRKVFGYPQMPDYSVVVFEVPIEPLEWTLPGYPSPAPKGADTELTDLESGPEPEANDFGDWLRGAAQQSIDTLQEWDRMLQETLDSWRGWN